MKPTGDLSTCELEDLSTALSNRVADFEKQLADIRIRLGEVRGEIAKRSRPAPKPRVSDHAVLRFAERVFGFEFHDLKKEILSPRVVEAIEAGATSVTIQGVKMIVKNKTIVTVLTKTKEAA
jgi:hypothetical protein